MSLDAIETCLNCGQKNRLPDPTPPGKRVICGACKEPLLDVADEDDDSDDDEDA